MKIFISLLICFTLVSENYSNEDLLNKLIPLADGTFKIINSTDLEELSEILQADSFNTLEVKFYLYTTRNPKNPQTINLNDNNSLKNSNFNRNNPTRIITHGWRNDGNSKINTLIRDAYLRRGNYNIICVDWSSVAHSLNYISAKNAVENVGSVLANFIDFLNAQAGMSFNSLYLIGHSLGAHASGFAGKFVKKGRINTIIGLDPASPLFDINNPSKRLATGDANYVETIHTNGGKLGFFEPIGTTSFYPDGGKHQSQCGEDLTGQCSHSTSYKYFADSINGNNNFSIKKCNNFQEVRDNKCSLNAYNVKMGGEPSNNGKVNGIYYVNVK